MAQTPQRSLITQYSDGQVVISKIRKKRNTIPIFGANEEYSATLVTSWYDGSPMDDAKADGSVYFKLKALPQGADPDIYGQYVGSYFRVNLPKFGETFLEKDTMQAMRDLSPVEVLLLKMGYYKGVKLNGYYTKDDTPAPIEYYLSETADLDDGGSVIVVGDIKLQHAFNNVIHYTYFGIRKDTSIDYTESINRILSLGDTIEFEDGIINIHGTVNLGSNKTIRSTSKVTLKGLLTFESTGGFPNTMFKNKDSSNENIRFENISFDFSRGGRPYAVGAGLTTKNSLVFTNVTNLSFETCEFKSFVTNLDSTIPLGKELLRFGMMLVDNCKKCSFNNIYTFDIKEEVFNIYKSSEVSLTNWTADSNGQTSSHCGVWYCDGVTIDGAKIIHTGGSVMNICSRNMAVRNVRVNENEPSVYGAGIDIGNELEEPGFEVSNIVIENNIFNVGGYGIFCQSNSYDSKYRQITIQNNIFNVKSTAKYPSVLDGIRVGSPDGFEILNNNINVDLTTTTGLGRCIRVNCKEEYILKGLSVVGNKGKANAFIQFQNHATVGGTIDSFTISNNSFEAYANQGGQTSYSGDSSFVYLRNTSGQSKLVTISNILISNNKVSGLSGGYLIIALDVKEMFTFKNLTVDNNTFEGAITGMDRDSLINNKTSSLSKVLIKNNVVVNGRQIVITDSGFVTIEDNIFNYRDITQTTQAIRVISASHQLIVRNNNFLRAVSSYNVLQVDSAVIPVAISTNNTAIRDNGTIYFSTNLVNTGYTSNIDAKPTVKGVVNQAIAQVNISQADLVAITTADGSDATTTQDLANAIKAYINANVVPLVNAIKSSQNTELTNQRTAGQQAP